MQCFKMAVKWRNGLPAIGFLFFCAIIIYFPLYSLSCSPEVGGLFCTCGRVAFFLFGTSALILSISMYLNILVIRRGKAFICVDDEKVYFPKLPVSFKRYIELDQISSVFSVKLYGRSGIGIKYGKKTHIFWENFFEDKSDLIRLAKALARNENLEFPDLFTDQRSLKGS